MFKKIDSFLNSITMYKLLLFGLGALSLVSLILAGFEILPYGVLPYIYSLLILVFLSYFSNILFGKIWKAPLNSESSIITGLILFFIMSPAVSLADALVLALASLIAMLSKYVLALNKKHIWNPAALSVFILGLSGSGNAIWWVGGKFLLPFTIILAILILRKIKRFEMFFSFLVVGMATTLLTHPETFLQNFLSYPLIFLGSIMLTEPLTTPTRRMNRLYYGAIVGLLANLPFNIGPVRSTPELAIILGNIFSYFVSLRKRLLLELAYKKEVAKDIYEFAFRHRPNESVIDLGDLPGQYLEWTLPHQNADNRGVRRYFSIASGFDESELKIGMKITDTSSSFKKAMLQMKEGDNIAVGALAGDFVLPQDARQKLVFIAGGIGITPFRSMVKFILDEKKGRDAALFYAVKAVEEIAYRDVLDQIKTHYLINEFLTKETILAKVPDFKERTFYISGPNAMVENYKKMLLEMGLPRKQIKTDYFPGY